MGTENFFAAANLSEQLVSSPLRGTEVSTVNHASLNGLSRDGYLLSLSPSYFS
jgi:hypothetical protein